MPTITWAIEEWSASPLASTSLLTSMEPGPRERTRLWRFRHVATRYLNPFTRVVAGRLPGFGILIHRGRETGRTLRTPINVFRRGNVFVFFLTYGSDVEWEVLRSRDDGYRFRHFSTWNDKLDFERYWYGPEFSAWRADYQSFYTVPVLYVWHDLVVRGGIGELEVPSARSATSAQVGP
jgi:hypothetical protein